MDGVSFKGVSTIPSIHEIAKKIRTPRWIGYCSANKILEYFQSLVDSRNNQSRFHLFVSESNNGKTMLISRFLKLNPANDNQNGNAIMIPVLVINSPPILSKKRICSNMLFTIGSPFFFSNSHDVIHQIDIIIRYLKIKILIIDDFDNICVNFPYQIKENFKFLNTLVNDFGVNIILTITEKTLPIFYHYIEQTESFKVLKLNKWEYNDEYLLFIDNFIKQLPINDYLEISNTIPSKIFKLSDGKIGNICRILTETAIETIKSDKNRITVSILKSCRNNKFR